MADFCKACSIEIFGKDFEELAHITKPKVWEDGRACWVLCEGCGLIQVDPAGNCVSSNCLHAGTPGHGLPWCSQKGGTNELSPEGEVGK